MLTILDGPIGTELNRRGVATDLPRWSADAMDTAPDVLQQIHRDYALAGASVHTANTFRTKQRCVGDAWQDLTRRAVELLKASVPSDHRIAGSIAPLEDCYRPDLSPGKQAFAEHADLAASLVAAGVDLLLCETFPQSDEAIAAVAAASQTGVETWLALTAGPNATLMTPQQMAGTARRAVREGAAAILVNCTPAYQTLPFVAELGELALDVPIGAYANAGDIHDKIGWTASSQPGASAYAELAQTWMDVGATLIGSCCGTTPDHIQAISRLVQPSD